MFRRNKTKRMEFPLLPPFVARFHQVNSSAARSISKATFAR